jgi:hypothetical protein
MALKSSSSFLVFNSTNQPERENETAYHKRPREWYKYRARHRVALNREPLLKLKGKYS